MIEFTKPYKPVEFTRITTLRALYKASQKRRAVYTPSMYLRKPVPAAWVLHLQGTEIYRLIEHGLYLYPQRRRK